MDPPALPEESITAEVERHLNFGTVDVHAGVDHVARVEAVLAVLTAPE